MYICKKNSDENVKNYLEVGILVFLFDCLKLLRIFIVNKVIIWYLFINFTGFKIDDDCY